MQLKIILKNKTELFLNFSDGDVLLDVLQKNGIAINSMCEGNGACGGCHIIAETPDLLDEISEEEEATLDKASGVTLNSRLACRIKLRSKSDGLVIRIP